MLRNLIVRSAVALTLSAGAVVATAPAASATVPVEGTAHYVAHKITNKRLARNYADQWDAWQAYSRAFTDGCWQDFASAPRKLRRWSAVESGETSRIHKGWGWDFGEGDGC